MLGTLTRRLRLMGYDTISANALSPGNPREDSVILSIAQTQGRILLTRDAELARRAGAQGIYIGSEDPAAQVHQLTDMGLIVPSLRFDRCSICNTPLRPARQREIESAAYAPADRRSLTFFWCPTCRRLYWEGSHTRRMRKDLIGDQD
ncbi:hypothetical protein CUJ86_03805 [Methanofollis fontis]|uniref:Mut7-C RNAse domain-containing protein n=2 Tax=Methanofollis fontis TaxID=2052832 RepID=A0A483CY38_9EURY|nr:hypothetical protein CUJ86_03805 [Methanofollis fontis]